MTYGYGCSKRRPAPRAPRLAAIAVCALFGACSVDSTGLRDTHLGYNRAIDSVFADELLLNVVRLRYLDMTEFLEVSSITSQMSLSKSIGGDLGLSEGEPTALAKGGVGYSERPTISFAPRDYEEFTKTYLSPISVESATVLLGRGWQADRVLRLMVRKINGIWNDDRRAPGDFLTLAKTFSDMQLRGDVHFGYAELTEEVASDVALEAVSVSDLIAVAEAGYQLQKNDDGASYTVVHRKPTPVLVISERAKDAADLRRNLNLEGDRLVYPIRETESYTGEPRPKSSVEVQIRSFAEILAFLSQGVEVPERHRQLGIVLGPGQRGITVPENLLADLFRVRVAASRPEGASLAVEHRGHWFYIPDSDLDSRFTFLILSNLFRMEMAGTNSRRVPALTLPL